jgi:hypothetical protein
VTAGFALAPGEGFAPLGAAPDGDRDRHLDALNVSAREQDPALGGGGHAGTGTAAARRAVASAIPWITIGATTGSSSAIIFDVGSSWPCSARTFAARSCCDLLLKPSVVLHDLQSHPDPAGSHALDRGRQGADRGAQLANDRHRLALARAVPIGAGVGVNDLPAGERAARRFLFRSVNVELDRHRGPALGFGIGHDIPEDDEHAIAHGGRLFPVGLDPYPLRPAPRRLAHAHRDVISRHSIHGRQLV